MDKDKLLIVSSIAGWGLLLSTLLLTIKMLRQIKTLTKELKDVNERVDVFNPRALKEGDAAPKFTATTPEGATMTLDSFAGRSVAFIFSLPDCAPCKEKLPRLHQLQPAAREAGVELVLVLAAEEEAAQAFVAENHVRLPVLVAPFGKNSFVPDYRVAMFPGFCLIDAEHKVRASGPFDKWDRIAQEWEQAALEPA